MSVQVETIGYRFRVSKGSGVYDIISTTELGITKSNEVIRAFFDNFKIIKSDRIVKQEEVATGENKTSASIEGNDVGKVGEIGKVGEDHKVKPARKKREAMKSMWGNLRELLNDEFTIDEYKKALTDAGYEYTKGSWAAVPGIQLKKIVKLGKIEKIEGTEPATYRKIKVPHSFRSDQNVDNTIKSLKDGKRVLMGAIK
jgi:hypothetical protein